MTADEMLRELGYEKEDPWEEWREKARYSKMCEGEFIHIIVYKNGDTEKFGRDSAMHNNTDFAFTSNEIRAIAKLLEEMEAE